MVDVSARRRAHLRLWRIIGPLARALAGLVPWWVLLETRGRTSGMPRRTPLAQGPKDGGTLWLIAVHGHRAAWVRNIEASPLVRVRRAGRWHEGHASVEPYDPEVVRRFNAYARGGPRVFGIEPVLVAISLS